MAGGTHRPTRTSGSWISSVTEKTGLSEAELEVLKVLWDAGPATVREVQSELASRGRRWAYTTVATLIQRVAGKGFITTAASAIPHVYHPAVSRDELLGRRLKEAADDLCGGDTAPLLLALVQGDDFTPEELARFRRILDEAAKRDPAAAARERSATKRKKT